MDFYKIKERSIRKGEVEVYPDFKVGHVTDLLVRAKTFYAVWNSDVGLWSTDELDVADMVDSDLWKYAEEVKNRDSFVGYVNVKTMESDSTGSWNRFQQYLKRYPDSKIMLDNKLTFANTEVRKKDYVSRRLPYSLEEGDWSAWDELVSTLYEPPEREKIEWAIGSIVSGDSKTIQKFCVFFGEAGTGKSTIINIIQKLFDGYYVTFDAKALASSNNQFAAEMFRSNPLVAIQHDGDLSRIEDNTKLNSIVSHEMMTINEKGKPQYMSRANAFLFMGTNRPVKITDSKSGIIRRLIDIRPSGKRIPPKQYQTLISRIDFQLGAIAKHCLDVYRDLGKHYYDGYRPRDMMMQTDVFFNFVHDQYDIFNDQIGVSLKQAYLMYKEYCDESLVEFKLPKHKFREELKDYFEKFEEVARVDGKQIRNWYSGFRVEKFAPELDIFKEPERPYSLSMDSDISLLDEMLKDCPAQLASQYETPKMKWDGVKTKLSDIDTHQLHYVKVPENHIVIDFDIKDSDGNKSFEKNLEAASKWPPTYSELSKSGSGIHLHYIYDGDVTKLSRLYSEAVEIKVFTGNSSLRRKLTKCNDIPVATISSGLPLKGVKMVNVESVKSEKKLRELIERNLAKEIHPGTKPSCDFIKKILDDAYESGLKYDVSDLKHDVLIFAMNSTNQSDYCIRLVEQMKWRSDEPSQNRVIEYDVNDSEELVFFDIEVFPPNDEGRNGLFVNWKVAGPDRSIVRMIDPSPDEILELFKRRLVGFNCRRYDNHILYARAQGYTLKEIYDLSVSIINGARDAFFGEAYNVSYTDVFDFSSKKQSLKKFEIELGIHHQELGLKWYEPVPKGMEVKVAEYCDNDVLATEAVFNARQADFTARKILAAVAGMTVNDTTNSLTTKIIFGNDRHPQSQFNYRFMGDDTDVLVAWGDPYDGYTMFDSNNKPIFPGYTYDARRKDKSIYRDESIGEGGYVYAEPGIYTNVALLDIASMHPSSIVAEELFGPIYTKRFKDILDARIAIKHKDFTTAKTLLDGKLAPYLKDERDAKDLAQALKIAINSVYGLTSASFDNPFCDRRNVDNIVAKRGALFMVNLKHEVQKRGFTVAHIKTDSIKIPNATPEIINMVMEYGKLYGYNFEHEATYDRMCLVNDAVYIAKYDNGEWTATGTQFQRPYVFKTLFSKEPIEFDDVCETNSVTGALYLDFNENLPNVEQLEKEKAKLLKQPDSDDKTTMLEELDRKIAEGHCYIFIGRVGRFMPVLPGCNGGILYREKDGKYYAVGGSKGYRWKEAELVRRNGKESELDESYYKKLVDEAVETIDSYGDFERFVSPEPYSTRSKKVYDEPWLLPCGDGKYNTCMDCPHCHETECDKGYSLNSYISEG